MLIFWDEQHLRIPRQEIPEKLSLGAPSIRLARVPGTGDQGLLVSVLRLQPQEEKIVALQLREILELI